MSDYNFKYRPQRVGELNLTIVRESLTRVLKSGEIPHAFLFSGPRGTGKTSAARILAKAVNCVGEKPEGFEPCNVCEQCLSITTGSNLDVLEIDAASNRGIDDIRDLREKVKLAPTASKYKVYIIDEVHMLTTEAFNALLKTLEEPPKHAIFVLCTTEPEKLPDTIISRCIRVNFKKAQIDETVEKLQKIVQEEKLEATPEALRLIAKGGGGSFRDSLKILEHASFSKEKITEDKVKEILGQTVGLDAQKLLELMLAKDTLGSLSEVNRVVNAGANLRVYTEQVLERLRGLLLIQVGLSLDEAGLDTDPEIEISVSEIRKLIEIFSRVALETKDALVPQLPLELAVVEYCETDKTSAKPKSIKSDDGEKGEPPKETKKEEEKAAPKEEKIEQEELETKVDSKGGISSGLSVEEVRTNWSKVLSSVKSKNVSLEAVLKAAVPLEFDGRFLTIEVYYQFHKDKLETDKCRSLFERVSEEIYGIPFALKCVLGKRSLDKHLSVIDNTRVDYVPPEIYSIRGSSPEEDVYLMAEKIFNEKKEG